MKPHLLMLLAFLPACGGDNTLVANQQLSDALSISNVVKREIRDPDDPSQLVGLVVDIDLVNTRLIPIEAPFDVAWTLQDAGGDNFATDTVRIDRMSSGAVRRLVFTFGFGPIPSLAGFRDAVTFDFVDPPPTL
jgi:hypothetical protein